MRVLFDTNVLLDVLLDREPWIEWSSACWQANDEGRVTGYVAGLDAIVTRDKEGFAEGVLPVLTPEELVQQIS